MKIIFFFLLIVIKSASGITRVVHFEPEEVELSGHLDLQTFPGIPNYESIKSGDEIERHFYLVLKEPVNVVLTRKDSVSSINGDSFYGVTTFQLVINDDKHWAMIRQLGEGKKVKIFGSIFQRHTGHHHSRVLLEVRSILPINSPEN